MKWRTAFLILTVVMLGTACGTAPPAPPPTPSPSPTEEPVELIISGDGFQSDYASLLDEQIALFEEAYPHITITTIDWAWTPQTFAGDLAAGTVPDVMNIAATEADLVIDNGYAADLTPHWDAWEFSDNFNEQIIGTYARNDRIYGVPSSIYIMGLFYDKTLFNEAGLVDDTGEAIPPTTWAEFAEAAQAVKANTDAAGFCMLTQINQGGWNFMNWGWQAGGTFQEQVNGEWVASFDEQPIVDAMTFMHELRWEYDVLQDELELDAAALLEGKLAAHECGMAFIAPDWLQTIAIDGTLDQFGLTKLPTGPDGDANLMGGSFDIIRTGLSPEKEQAAFQWILWYNFSLDALENDLQSEVGRNRWIFLNRSLMYKPNSDLANQEQELLDKYRGLPYYRDYVEAAARYARTEPPIATQEMYALLDEVLWEVLTNEDADIQALLSDAAAEFEADYLPAD